MLKKIDHVVKDQGDSEDLFYYFPIILEIVERLEMETLGKPNSKEWLSFGMLVL